MSSADLPPTRDSILISALKFCVGVLLFIGLGGASSYLTNEAWWYFAVAPKTAAADELVKANKPAQALPVILDALKDYPDDPKLLYLAIGLYLMLDQPLMAHFYKQAYVRLEDVDRERRQLVSELTTEMSMRLESQLAALQDETSSLYETLNRNRQYARLTDVQAIMQAPASAAVGEPGYFYPEQPLRCSENKRCSFKLTQSKLFNAVQLQTVSSTEVGGGEQCCSLSLSDPDLRPMPIVQDEFMKFLATEKTGFNVESIDGAQLLVQFRARVLMKQLYLKKYADGASWPRPPEPTAKWVARWAGYIIWVLGCFGLFFKLDDWAERRARPKSG